MPLLYDIAVLDGTVACIVRVDLTIALEASAEFPAQFTYQFEVIQTTVPALKEQVFRGKAALVCCLYHGHKMVVPGQPIMCMVIDAVVARNVAVAICS